jgi:hypothetical protein
MAQQALGIACDPPTLTLVQGRSSSRSCIRSCSSSGGSPPPAWTKQVVVAQRNLHDLQTLRQVYYRQHNAVARVHAQLTPQPSFSLLSRKDEAHVVHWCLA